MYYNYSSKGGKIMTDKELIIPNHIGIIMDGNGRWATKRGLNRSAGHKEGAKTLKKLLYKLVVNKSYI